MYNRYIGNTGKYYRVEEKSDLRESVKEHTAREPIHNNAPIHVPPHPQPVKKPSLFGGGLKFLSGSGGGLKFLSGGGGAKFLDNVLPFGLETSDLIILALFLFLYIESGDEEFLIILGFLAYSIFKDNKDK